VARSFEEVADLLEIQRTKPFRVRADRNATRAVRDLAGPPAGMAEFEIRSHHRSHLCT